MAVSLKAMPKPTLAIGPMSPPDPQPTSNDEAVLPFDLCQSFALSGGPHHSRSSSAAASPEREPDHPFRDSLRELRVERVSLDVSNSGAHRGDAGIIVCPRLVNEKPCDPEIPNMTASISGSVIGISPAHSTMKFAPVPPRVS